MSPLFQFRDPEAAPAPEPVPIVFPKATGAEIAAAFAGQPVTGYFYDSMRPGTERILIGMLDVGGRREDNHSILATAQRIFREAGAELFSPADLNESEALTELNLRMNRGLIEAANGVRSCPAFLACYHEKFGTLCYINAGHTPALLRDHTGITALVPTGLQLGLFSHATSEAPTIGMEKGACLLLVSRGVVAREARHADNDRSGMERIEDQFQRSQLTSAQDVCTSILTSLPESGADSPAARDRTALVLLRTA